MTQLWQVFAAPGDDPDEPLPGGPSPGIFGRDVRIDREQWLRILEFAATIDPVRARRLEELSHVEPPNPPPLDREELIGLIELLQALEPAIEAAEPLNVEGNSRFEDILENFHHAGMVREVRIVLGEALARGQPFSSWVD